MKQFDIKVQRNIDMAVAAIQDTIPNASIYLFGSFAYGTPTAESDLDLYIVTPDKSKSPLEWCFEAQMALPMEFNMPSDVLVNYEDEFLTRAKSPVTFEHTVYTKGIKLSA